MEAGVRKHSRKERGEREREMNRWSGLRAEPVYSVTISMWVQYGTVETISHQHLTGTGQTQREALTQT